MAVHCSVYDTQSTRAQRPHRLSTVSLDASKFCRSSLVAYFDATQCVDPAGELVKNERDAVKSEGPSHEDRRRQQLRTGTEHAERLDDGLDE